MACLLFSFHFLQKYIIGAERHQPSVLVEVLLERRTSIPKPCVCFHMHRKPDHDHRRQCVGDILESQEAGEASAFTEISK